MSIYHYMSIYLSSDVYVSEAIYRVAKIHSFCCNLGHFLQMSLQLLVKLAENDLYHNESYESSPPFKHNSLLQISQQVDFGF